MIILLRWIEIILLNGGKMPENVAGFDKYIAALITVAVSVLVGFIIQFLINSRLVKFVHKTPWKGDNVIVEGIRGRIILWSVVVGIYLAVPMLHLPPDYYIIIRKIL